ncbi:hypothetical protein BLA29_008656, partial [Euroglyphus maynei]
MNDTDNLIVTRTKVQHTEDENNRHLFENLEMRRLGLPTQFSSAKSKKFYKKKRKRNRNLNIDRILHNWNSIQISSLDDSDDKNQIDDEDKFVIQHHLIESNVNVEMAEIFQT